MSTSTIQTVAVLTCSGYEQYKHDDHAILLALNQRNIAAKHVLWNTVSVEWRTFKAVFIRSTWGYCTERRTLDCFLQTLRSIAEANVSLINPLETITWNLKKTYLQELSAKGVPILETLWLSKSSLSQLRTLLAKKQLASKDWHDCVIKPVISAGGMHTKRFCREEVEQVVASCSLLDVDEWMVQPFAPEIVTEGERSFVFIEESYSHCVLKRPAPGNFLVNETQGGSSQKEEPASWMVEQVKAIRLKVDKSSLLTRIDTIRRGRELILMEVECIEPLLYLETKPEAANSIAAALEKRLAAL